jgi:hypothetical protein
MAKELAYHVIFQTTATCRVRLTLADLEPQIFRNATNPLVDTLALMGSCVSAFYLLDALFTFVFTPVLSSAAGKTHSHLGHSWHHARLSICEPSPWGTPRDSYHADPAGWGPAVRALHGQTRRAVHNHVSFFRMKSYYVMLTRGCSEADVYHIGRWNGAATSGPSLTSNRAQYFTICICNEPMSLKCTLFSVRL